MKNNLDSNNKRMDKVDVYIYSRIFFNKMKVEVISFVGNWIYLMVILLSNLNKAK